MRPSDFLLLTEPGLGEPVRTNLLRARFAAKVEIEPEEHTSVVVFGEDGGIPNVEFGEPGAELLDADLEPTLSGEELERMRIEARMPAWGKELDDSILPAEAGLDETHVSFTKGCYPGQEPIARLRHRGKVNRSLRVLEVDSAEPGDEIRHGEKVVGRVTSVVPGRRARLRAHRRPRRRGTGSRRRTHAEVRPADSIYRCLAGRQPREGWRPASQRGFVLLDTGVGEIGAGSV